MTDITKCFRGCKKQDSCYRWYAKDGARQSYADFEPDENGNCDHYWNRDGKEASN